MSTDTKPALPALMMRSIGESEYRELRRQADELARARARADELEGLLARSEAALGRRGGDALEELIADLLPALDDFERALAAARAEPAPGPIVAGVELVRRELLRVLGLRGVERIPVAAGDPLDLLLHQSIDGDELFLAGEPGARVSAELRAGYRRGKKILRRALVELAVAGTDPA